MLLSVVASVKPWLGCHLRNSRQAILAWWVLSVKYELAEFRSNLDGEDYALEYHKVL